MPVGFAQLFLMPFPLLFYPPTFSLGRTSEKIYFQCHNCHFISWHTGQRGTPCNVSTWNETHTHDQSLSLLEDESDDAPDDDDDDEPADDDDDDEEEEEDDDDDDDAAAFRFARAAVSCSVLA